MATKTLTPTADQLKPLSRFKTFPTHHCVTGSMQHIYHFNGHPLSEEMLLGLGAGIGYFYWQMKGQTPMLLGRGNVHRPGIEGLEIDTGRRSGVETERFSTGSATKASTALLRSMAQEQPVMIHVDMGFLPYFDLPDGYHFGQHVVVVAGLDEETGEALLADRDGVLHAISMEDLAQARGSTFKPFPPRHTWYSFDFAGKRQPNATDIWSAIAQVCESMLRGPISNLGVQGMRRTAKAVRDWPRLMDEAELRETAFNGFIFIDAQGGTGGGMFRYMYGRFLQEAGQICNCPELEALGEELEQIGDAWQDIAHTFLEAAEAGDPGDVMQAISDPLISIADREGQLWETLDQLGSTQG